MAVMLPKAPGTQAMVSQQHLLGITSALRPPASSEAVATVARFAVTALCKSMCAATSAREASSKEAPHPRASALSMAAVVARGPL